MAELAIAPVTELADVQALEACGRNPVEVQILSGAPNLANAPRRCGVGKPLGVRVSPSAPEFSD